MVGAGAHDGQAGSNVHALVHRDGFERREALVVIHGKHTVKAAVLVAAKETVGGIGAKAQDLVLVGLLNGWLDNLFLLVAQQTVVATVGVETQHGDAGLLHVEVILQ